MPRGDLVYTEKLNHGMRKKYGMPPSHNCVWVDSNITNDQRTENWESAFGKTINRKEVQGKCECTCNLREVHQKGHYFLIQDDCKQHGKGFRVPAKVSSAPKKHSLGQRKRVKKCVFYGDGDLRKVMNRN